ncbi:hypothetical protein Tco_0860194 [Tanacetum coccineum]|uniref:CCHC-type domain-containing protein n=1 Tax=Tanacetum coccineum TaxID=301880 RepID=A0ABQ5BHC1_9ASTR
MVAPVISISSDLSGESGGSSIPRVILFSSIPVVIPVAPEIPSEVPVAPKVAAPVVASPFGVLELDTHSSSKSGPSESSIPPVPVAPMISPFLYLDDYESDTEMPQRHVSSSHHDAMVARWRSRVALQSSSPTTSTSEILTTPILPAPPAIDIPVSRLYRTHPGRPCRALTARKSVGPLPSHRLALRYTPHHLDHFTLGHSSSRHTSLVTTVVDSSTPLRFIYPPPAKTSQYSEAYHRWRSPTATVTSAIPTPVALVPTRVDLLLPYKRFRDSYTPKDSVEEGIDADVLVDIEADATVVEVVASMEIEAGIDDGIDIKVDVGGDREDEDEEAESSDRGTREVGVDVVVGIDIPDDMLMPDAVEHFEQLEEGVQDIYAHIMEIPLQRVEDIENMTITRSGMTLEVIEELITRRVEKALAAYEANRAAELVIESESQNGDDETETEMEDKMGMEIPIGMTEGNDLASYTQRFQELTMLCTKMVPEEEDRVEKFIGEDNRIQQPPYKRQNVGGKSVARAYTAGNNERRGYARPLPYCNKCKLHHEGPCTVKCQNCNKVRHMARDCRSAVATTAT